MQRYRVSFEILLNDHAGHPRKWIPETVCSGLEPGEDIVSWNFEELDDHSDSQEDL